MVLHKCFTMLNWAVWKKQKHFGGGTRKKGYREKKGRERKETEGKRKPMREK